MKLNINDLGPKVKGNSVTFRLWLRDVEPDARVLAIGSFCNWKPEDSIALHFDSESGIWKGEVKDLPYGVYEYGFMVKTGSWYSNISSDPFAKMTGKDGKSAFCVPVEKPARLDSFEMPPLEDLILYNLELDNFNYNFEGVKNRVLYYLSQLGVNGVIFSSWIGYDHSLCGEKIPLHFLAPDSRYGTPYDLKVMINECHKAGIAVIMDIDLHAVSPEFGYNTMYSVFQTKPMLGRLDDAAKKIYLNYSDEYTREFVFSICRWWLEEYSVDGFRFLNVDEYWDKAEGEGFARLVSRLYEFRKKDGELIYLFANDCGNLDSQVINRSYANGITNRHFIRFIHRMAENRTLNQEFWRSMDPNQLHYLTEKTLDKNVLSNVTLNAIEDDKSHSLVVKMGVVSGQRDRLGYPVGDRKNHWWKVKPYIIAQFTASGVPVIYNGQEIGHGRFLPDGGPDRFAARPIGWDYLADFAGKDLYRFHQKLVHIRNTFKSIRSKNFLHYFTDENSQVVVFKRYLDDETTVVAINFSNESSRVLIPFPSNGIWHEYLDDYDVEVYDLKAEVRVPARYGVIFRKK